MSNYYKDDLLTEENPVEYKIPIGKEINRRTVLLDLSQNTIVIGREKKGKTTILRMIAQKIRSTSETPLTVIHQGTTLKQAYKILAKLQKNQDKKQFLIVDDLEQLVTVRDTEDFTTKELREQIDQKLFELFQDKNNGISEITVIYSSVFYSRFLRSQYITDFHSGNILLLDTDRQIVNNNLYEDKRVSRDVTLGSAILKNPAGVYLENDSKMIYVDTELITLEYFTEDSVTLASEKGKTIF